jgi:hypothetical protein
MTSALTPTTDMSFAKRMLWNFRHFQTSSNSIVRASDFDSEGREFESLRARQQLGLQIKGFSQFRVRSYGRFRVADRYCAVLVKSTAYQALPITPRNTVATSGFAVCSLAVWITPLLSAVLHSGMTISGRHRQPSRFECQATTKSGTCTLSIGLSVPKKSGLSRPVAPIDRGGGRGSIGTTKAAGRMYPFGL